MIRATTMKWVMLSLVVGALCITSSKAYFDQDDEDDDFYAFIGQLGEESEPWIDPHDMIGDLDIDKESSHNAEVVKSVQEDTEEDLFASYTPEKEEKSKEPSYAGEADDIQDLKDELVQCKNDHRNIEEKLKIERERVKAQYLEKLKESSVDFKPFYTRIVYNIWDLLRLEEAQDVISESDLLVRHLQARIDLLGIQTLREYIGTKGNMHEVDKVIRNLFFEVEVGDGSSDTLDFLKATWENMMTHMKDIQKWLYFLSITFILLGVWTFYLFIMDIQRELRWGRVIWMMVILVFVICCLWEWNHMHKVAEVRYRARIAQRGFRDMPSECKPDHNPGWLVWARVRVFGGPDPCEEYYEDLMMDPKDEITPNKVISQTIAIFLVQPFESIGTHSARFLTSFYSQIPIAYQAPATLLFLVLLIIILFATCGYGIEFPFWLGAVRPFYSTPTASTNDGKEALDELRKDRDAFLTESRAMLTDITKAAIAQSQNNSQPVLITSQFLEERLETLVVNHLVHAMPNTTGRDFIGRAQERSLVPLRHDTAASTSMHAPRQMEKHIKDKVDGDRADVSICTKVEQSGQITDTDGCLPSGSGESGNVLRKRIVSTPKHSLSFSGIPQDTMSSANKKGVRRSISMREDKCGQDISENRNVQDGGSSFDEVGLDATPGSNDFFEQVSEIFDHCQRSTGVSDISQSEDLLVLSTEESFVNFCKQVKAPRSLEDISSDDSSNDSFMAQMKATLEE
ncbi:uncharacterized protein LOC143035771 isoform X2 [Oratosquilla oratoria]